jgi:hypothetical protein
MSLFDKMLRQLFLISVEFLETVDSSAMSNVAEERSALIAERRMLSSAFVSKHARLRYWAKFSQTLSAERSSPKR